MVDDGAGGRVASSTVRSDDHETRVDALLDDEEGDLASLGATERLTNLSLFLIMNHKREKSRREGGDGEREGEDGVRRRRAANLRHRRDR